MKFEFHEECSVEAGSEEFIKVFEKLEMYASQLYELIVLIKIKKRFYYGVTPSVQVLCNILLCCVTAVPFFLQFHSYGGEWWLEGLALSGGDQCCLEVTGQGHPSLARASVQGE